MSDLAIQIQGLSKLYQIGAKRTYKTVRETMMNWLRSPIRAVGRAIGEDKQVDPTTQLWALKDVSFDVARGEVVGIIGRNGAGKSTLLKVLSRITEPTAGRIKINGRVGSLLEVGTGFHPELTGRENIYLNGAILGMRRWEIARKFDEIVAFSEIEKFIDTPVKRYSSGMYTRLAFAVAAHLEPEILIVDEVLAVGDAEFQKKCLGKMQDVARGGRTVLFVSHNVAAIRNLCSRCVLLRQGQVALAAGTDEALAMYLQASSASGGGDLMDRRDRTGTGEVICSALRILDESGRLVSSVRPDRPFTIEVDYLSKEPGKQVLLSIDVDTVDGVRVTTLYSGFTSQSFRTESTGTLRCKVHSLPLRADHYNLNVFIGTEFGSYDFVRGAAVIEMSEVDFYNTGRKPERAHGPLLTRYDWERPTNG